MQLGCYSSGDVEMHEVAIGGALRTKAERPVRGVYRDRQGRQVSRAEA